MIRLPMLSALVLATIAACSAPAPQDAPVASAKVVSGRPLESLPPGFDPAGTRADLLATAADRFGRAVLAEARAAPTHLIVKRFAGMLPPPPPGRTTPRYTPPAAVLVKRGNAWFVGSASGWRPASAQAAADLDRILGDPSFWSEPAYVPPCPDFGASLLLLKVPKRAKTVRNSTCMSQASRLVEAALRA